MNQPKKILIIDDDNTLIMLTSMILSKAGYIVDSVESLEEAETYLKKTTPHLILLDIYLGDQNGLKLLKNKDLKVVKQSKVIIMSSSGKNTLITASMMLGACNYILKPFKSNRIRLAVRKALEDLVLKSYEVSENIEVEATCKGEIDAINEYQISLEANIKFRPETLVKISKSALIKDYKMQSCRFQAEKIQTSKEQGHGNILSILGISEESKQIIRQNQKTKKLGSYDE